MSEKLYDLLFGPGSHAEAMRTGDLVIEPEPDEALADLRKLAKTPSSCTVTITPVYPMGEKLSDLLDALKKAPGAEAPKAPPTVPKCGFCGGSGRVRSPRSAESCSACAGTGMILQGGVAAPPASPPPAVVRPLTLAERLKQKQEAPAAVKADPPRYGPYPSGDPPQGAPSLADLPPGAPWEEPVHTLARIGDREINLLGHRTCEEASANDEIGVDVTCDGAGIVRGVHVYIPVSRKGITDEVFDQLIKLLDPLTKQRIFRL